MNGLRHAPAKSIECNYLFYMIFQARVAYVAALLLGLACVHGQAAAAALQWQRVELGTADSRYPFAIYSNKPWQGDMSRVRTAVLVFHGLGRNGDAYYAAAEKLLLASGKADETLLLAPNFFNPADEKRQPVGGLPLWQSSRWNYGADAMNWPRPLSSFQPIDDVLSLFADRARFPKLESVVLAGHSGGGQLVHRYSVLNAVDETLRAAGIRPRYIIANPSSFLYFTPERPIANGAGFAPYELSRCPNYDVYRYGMDKLPSYAGGLSAQALFQRYAGREVAVLLGGADNNPNHAELDKTCGAQAGGSNRLERGRNYIRYERYLAKTGMTLNRQAYEVIAVGHSQGRMFGSKCGARLLFGLAEEANAAGSACREPQL